MVLAWIGGIVGWLALPSAQIWLTSAIRSSSWLAKLAGLTLGAIYWVMVRAIADMVTNLRDLRYLERDDPLRDRLTVIDGRLGWGPSILMIWTSIESLLALLASVALVVRIWSKNLLVGSSLSMGTEKWLMEFFGWLALVLACFSLLARNSNPVFPLPYRWLGFSRNATEQEARELQWAWSRRPPPPL